MKIKDVLIINSYAGSLTIAATQLGLKIRGSYEDAGYGLKTQRLNFPKLNYIEKLPWPSQDLSQTLVIAHPPCAAFSSLVLSKAGQQHCVGTGAANFEPHQHVMDYALRQGCAALAVESVPRILQLAGVEQGAYAKRYGYRIFWLLQNAVSFGVPQWRPRAWTIFMKTNQLILKLLPKVRTIDDIIFPRGTPLPNNELVNVLRRLRNAKQLPLWEEFLNGEEPGTFLRYAIRQFKHKDRDTVRRKLGLAGQFEHVLPRMLSREEFAPTLLHNSSFFIPDRELYVEEYAQVMGFPPNYKWSSLAKVRAHLSKGVCPPVARWILSELSDNLAGRDAYVKGAERLYIIEPGETADLTVKRGSFRQKEIFT